MSLLNWFEAKHQFGGLIGALIKKDTKSYIISEKEKDKYIKLILLKDYGLDVIITRTCFMLDF